MRACDMLENPVDFVLGVYFHHCAIAMSCRQLAMAGRYLAFSGRQDGLTVLSPERARRINALMLMFGPYDGRSEGRRVGKECLRPFRSRWSPYPSKKTKLSFSYSIFFMFYDSN